MNPRVYLVDRDDQAEWYVGDAISFCLQVKDKKIEIREWLEENTTGVVVISGQGKLPPPGLDSHWTSIFQAIRKDQYKLFFQNNDDAMMFKLTWGGQ